MSANRMVGAGNRHGLADDPDTHGRYEQQISAAFQVNLKRRLFIAP
jgi:hypothetical protein